MPAPTLEKQDVVTVLESYRQRGERRPGLLKLLDEVGKLKGLDRKVGSIPRLKKLLDEIDLAETHQRFEINKPLPDPISALASQLYNQLFEDFADYETRIREEYRDDIAALKQQNAQLQETKQTLEKSIDNLQQENQQMQLSLSQAQQTIDEQQQAILAAQATIAQKDAFLEKADEAVNATKALLASREKEFNTQITHASEKLQTLNNSLQQLAMEHAGELKEKANHISDLQNDVIGRQAFMEELKDKITKLEDEIETLKTRLKDNDQATHKLNETINSLQQDKQENQQTLLSMQALLTDKSEEILRLNQDLVEKEKIVNDLRSTISDRQDS